MSAEPSYAPAPPGAPPLVDLDAEERELQRRIKFNERVSTKTDELRIIEAARARLAAERLANADYTGVYLTRQQLLDLRTPDALIDRVLPRHAYVILRGRDHSFKSFVAIDWACCLATGKPWQGHPVDPVRVLYIAGEGAHGLAARVAAWEYAWGRNVPDDMLTIRRTALNLHTPGPAFDDLLARVEHHRYGLVVVDTLRRVSGSADANSSEMGTVVDNLDRIKQATDAGTILAVAHTDKGDHDTRGYSGIEDDADVVWAVKRDPAQMYFTLELTKMKDGPDGRTLHLEATTTLTSLTLTGVDGQPTPPTTESQIRILDTMRDLFPDGAPSGRLLTASGLPEATFYRALKDLRHAGHLLNTGSNHRPFYEFPALVPPDSDTSDSQPEPTESHTDDSPELPLPETPSDLADSHDSHPLSPPTPMTPTTPTPFRGGSSESESETNTPQGTP